MPGNMRLALEAGANRTPLIGLRTDCRLVCVGFQRPTYIDVRRAAAQCKIGLLRRGECVLIQQVLLKTKDVDRCAVYRETPSPERCQAHVPALFVLKSM
jgi:hypothetical protein